MRHSQQLGRARLKSGEALWSRDGWQRLLMGGAAEGLHDDLGADAKLLTATRQNRAG
jgi:hypothetical protein